MGRPRASYGQLNETFSDNTAGGPDDAMCCYCNNYIKIARGKVWRWADSKEWVLANTDIETIEKHLITKKPKDSKRG